MKQSRSHKRSLSGSARIKVLIVLGGIVAAVGLASAAWAYFTSHGSGTASASVGSLNSPTDVTVPATSGPSVLVSWTAPSNPGITLNGYYVQRYLSGTPSPACGSSPSSLVSTTSCDDLNVSSGTYTYEVTAVFRTWTATSTSSDSVTVYTTAPTVTGTVIAQAANARVDGYIQEDIGYYVYANVSDTSGPGVASVTANVTNVTSNDAAVTLSSGGGPFTTPGGLTYDYRSSLLTSNPSQSDGPVSYTVNAEDTVGNTSSYSNNGSVNFDSTPPTVSQPIVNGHT